MSSDMQCVRALRRDPHAGPGSPEWNASLVLLASAIIHENLWRNETWWLSALCVHVLLPVIVSLGEGRELVQGRVERV